MAEEESPNNPLPDIDKKSASGVTTPDLVADEKNQQDELEKVETLPGFTEEYPTGRALIPIVASILIAVFLVALDMVSCS